MNLRLIFNTCFLLLLWLPVLEILELEWRFNEQYHFGYFVPFFTLYLLYIRWDERPAPDAPKQVWPWLILLALAMIPIQVIETANPDWRLVYWMAAGCAFLATLLWITGQGGLRWTKHFIVPLAMILFAVPWIMSIEKWITMSLMEMVSSVTVEILNLSGIFAVQTGNVIYMQDAVVGVEEACSGVRSLQSSLMAGYLFGEIAKLRFSFRGILIASGVGMTLILNLNRTLALTMITLKLGSEGFDKWHDVVGNTAAIIGFLLIALLAWLLSKFKFSKSHSGNGTLHEPGLKQRVSQRSITISQLLTFCCVLISALVFDKIWFSSTSSQSTNLTYANANWTSLSSNVKALDIAPTAAAQLKFSEGQHYIWKSQKGLQWSAFYFRWDKGKISSHAGVHRPENCLPATGMSVQKTHEPFLWTTPEGYQISFKVITFSGLGRKMHVFFAVWDENGTKPWVSITWFDRITDVFQHRIVNGRHSIQVLIENSDSIETSKSEFEKMLNQVFAKSD